MDGNLKKKNTEGNYKTIVGYIFNRIALSNLNGTAEDEADLNILKEL